MRISVQFRLLAALVGLGVASGVSHPAAADEAVRVLLSSADNWPIDHATHHVQGIAVSPDRFWITSVDKPSRTGWIYQVDRQSLDVVGQRQIERGAQYHPGGLQLAGSSLWVAVAEYRPRSKSTVLKLSSEKMAEEASFAVNDHLGAMAADGQGHLWAANWDARQIYHFAEDGTQLARVENPTGVAYQDLEWHDGLLYGVGLAKGEPGQTEPAAVVDAIDPAAWKLVTRYLLSGQPDHAPHFAREGFSRLGSDFFLLPEDGPHTRVYRFPLPLQP